MKITLFGVRGSLPTPQTAGDERDKLKKILQLARSEWEKNPQEFSEEKFLTSLPTPLDQHLGGNTTCLYLEGNSGERLIFDMGTGVRVLGNQLAPLAFGKDPLHLNILISHTHWDHIQGWPFFKPAYSPNTSIDFYSCIPNLEERLIRQQHPENFPITLEQMMSKRKFTLWTEFESYPLGGLKVIPFQLRHPGACTGYRVREGNKVFLFCTDVEYREEDRQALLELKPKIAGADLLVIDAQYSIQEADQKVGWGHTSMRKAVEFAEMMEIKTVVLTHHEPDHKDAEVVKIASEEVSPQGSIQVVLAKEGLCFSLND